MKERLLPDEPQRTLRIAFIGQKGMPPHFGGIEFHVDELARRLAARGHDVSVYVRNWYTPRHLRVHEGVRLLHAPTLHTKHLDAALHSLTASLHAVLQDYDVVHYHGLGPSVFASIARLRGYTVVVTVHALDWERPKWGVIARALLKTGERAAVRIPEATVVVSRLLETYFSTKYRRRVNYIPNGVTAPSISPPQLISERYGLRGNDYVLYVGRLVPEKRVEWLIRAFRQTTSSLQLVVAGHDDDARGYARQLRETAGGDPRVLFVGTVGGRIKEELLSNAVLYVTASNVEGLPIAVLEAMAHGRCCLASDIPAHQEIIATGRDGLLFDCNDIVDLVTRLAAALRGGDGYREALGEAARLKVCEHYTWDRVADLTEELYYSLLRKRQAERDGSMRS